MRTSLLLLAVACSALHSSSSTSSHLTAENSPERWAHYDMTVPPDNNTTILQSRRRIGVCEAIVITQSCASLAQMAGGAVAEAFRMWARVIWERSQHFSCDKYIGTYKEISFKFQAHGGDCSTTAQQSTIAGAIEHHLRTVNGGRLCGTECLRLTHGGTWNGYLLLAKARTFDPNVYCGPDLDYSPCSSGGKADFH